ncbi:MAG: hypothetical protein QXD19_04730 [Candidatus Bathyarchaeia archaeon]
MQTSKKTLSLLITALLTLSMIIAAVPLASAAVVDMGTFKPDKSAALTSGKVGTKVLVNGTGANPYGPVKIYWDDVITGTVLNTTTASSVGYFECLVTIPAAVNGVHTLIAQDNLGYANGTSFTVTASITTGLVTKVLPGDSLPVSGSGFSANKSVTISLNTTTANVTLGTATTDGVGSFSTSVTVPAINVTDYGPFAVFAIDANNVTAYTIITIDYYVNVMPAFAPPGVTITISGRIPANTDYEVRINTTTVESGTSGSTGTFSETYTLPTLLATGNYTVGVFWGVVNNRTTLLTVGPSPTITLSATSGVAGAKVTVTGSSFSGSANVTLYYGATVVNSTATDARFGPTNISGSFTADFVVPALTPGPYVVKVVDQYGAVAQTVFTIQAAPTTTIELRSTQYLQGDTLSFNVYTTESSLGTITVTITDPTGGVWWNINTWSLTNMVTYQTIPYADQVDARNNTLKLPDDAPTGTWNWTVTYTPASTGTATKATGLFTVSAKPTLASVQAQINQLSAQVNSLGGNLSAINSQLSSISSTVSGISGAASSAASAANSAKSAADSAKSAADAAKAAADAAKASADSAVSAIEDAKTAAQSAASAANAAKSSADSAVSAIEDATTAAESAKAAAEGVSMAVWIAVVLSLVAAIAAIFAVITIRGKIAG